MEIINLILIALSLAGISMSYLKQKDIEEKALLKSNIETILINSNQLYYRLSGFAFNHFCFNSTTDWIVRTDKQMQSIFNKSKIKGATQWSSFISSAKKHLNNTQDLTDLLENDWADLKISFINPYEKRQRILADTIHTLKQDIKKITWYLFLCLGFIFALNLWSIYDSK